jgi:uncharacterized protein YfiM (DUF2279 family)
MINDSSAIAIINAACFIGIVLCIAAILGEQIHREREAQREKPWYIGPLHAWWARHVTIPRALKRLPLLAVLVSTPAGAQKLAVAYGYTKGQAQRALGEAWRTGPNERVFCSAHETWYVGDSSRALAVFVDSVAEMIPDSATATRFTIRLGACGKRGQFHTHTRLADCNFSRPDRESFALARAYVGRLYEGVVCGDSAVIFQFAELRTDTAPRVFPPPGPAAPYRSASPFDTTDSARAQAEIARARKTLDSLSREIDKLDSLERRTARELQRVFKARWWFGGALATALVANTIWNIDRDPGGYPDTWKTPDKLNHMNQGYFLSTAGMAMGVRPWWAAGLTCAAAAGFEVTQGYISSKDIIAGCAGAAAASGASWVRKRVKRNGGLR